MNLIDSLFEDDSELIKGKHPGEPIVLSSRLRLARNIDEVPFPGWASTSQRKEILSQCFKALGKIDSFKKGIFVAVDSLSSLEKQILFERRLISRDLMSDKESAGIVVNTDQSCAVMVNEEDHLRVQMLRRGFHFDELWKSINSLDSQIEGKIDYAFSAELGYLTACPTNVGTGMRASAMMHLPGLVMGNQMEKVIRAVNQAGIAVRGLFGEGSDASGSIFQISNQQTLGASEDEIIRRLTTFLNQIIEQEKNARLRLIENESGKLADKIGRAFGIITNSFLISSSEAMNLLSIMRLAVDLEVVPEDFRLVIDRGFIECQPGHIQHSVKGEVDARKRDDLRARYLREQFGDLPSLNFSAIF